MKLYKLRFQQSDFVDKQSTIWRTDVVDLYDNDQYKNYTALKAPYGTDLLGNGVYTGLNSSDGINSEIGYVSSGRFVDTSGLIDIIEWKISASQTATAPIGLLLNVYSTDDSSLAPYYLHATPSIIQDWTERIGLRPGTPIYDLSANRYVFFEIVFESDAVIQATAEIELIVAIEISSPIINGFFPATRLALDRFPEWMSMREYDPEDLNDDNKATPTQIGSQLINAMAGEWLTDLRGTIRYEEFQRYIEAVDLDRKAWVWKTNNLPLNIFSVTYLNGVDTQLTYTNDIAEFYNANDDEHLFFYNVGSGEIFTLQQYPEGELKVNGEAVEQVEHQVWNGVDDIGVTVDLFRLPSEDNDSFRKRILDVYRSKPGVSSERFKLAIRRELNLWKYFSATPDSDFQGATPDVVSMEDIESASPYFDTRGNANSNFYDLVEDLAHKYPVTWGLFKYGHALWDPDGLKHLGFNSIPKQLDTATPDVSQYQSGVGDLNDIFVLRPDFYQPDHSFDVTLSVRGKQSTPVSTYTEIPIKINLVGYGSRTIATYGSSAYPFHIKLTHVDSRSYIANLNLNANYYGGDPGTTGIDLASYAPGGTWPPPATYPGAEVVADWYGPNGFVSDYLSWYDALDGVGFAGTSATPNTGIILSEITQVEIIPGVWNPNTQTVSNVPDTDYYRLYFSDVGLTDNLGYTGTASIVEAAPDFDAQDLRLEFECWEYIVSVNDVSGFETIPQEFDFKLNESDTQQTATITVSNFDWPDFNDSGLETQSLVIGLFERNENGDYGVYTRTGLFVDASNIDVNGNTSWSVDGKLTLALGTPLGIGETYNLVFTCSGATGYPENVDVWTQFKALQVSPLVDQIVTEHGPYRNGQAPMIGNHNNVLSSFNFTRADFGLGEDEVITWIGVESISNSNVLVWLDSNSVVPLGEDPNNYPTHAIIEYDDGGKYLDTINVYVKLKPNLNPEWNPFLHSGWFYEDEESYYLYANPQTATVTSGTTLSLGENPYQGAPITVDAWGATPLRQVPYSNLDHSIVETTVGTDDIYLYTGYRDIYNVSVTDLNLNESVSLTATSFSDNEITTTSITNPEHTYEITYFPRLAFHIDSSATPGYSDIVFSEAASGSTPYHVTWETSKYNPATPISLPLHPIYSSVDESFIYLDHNEHDLSYVEINISDPTILATPGDYAMVTVTTYDSFGNPKPNIVLNLYVTTDVDLSTSQVITDDEGRATFYIDSKITSTSGIVSATPASYPTLGQSSGYYVQLGIPGRQKLRATMDSNETVADGSSGNTLFGSAYDQFNSPMQSATVYWKKGRDIKTVFDMSPSVSSATPGQSGVAGAVVTDNNGRFTVGPFISQDEPGYWLISVESGDAGDITYWYEYLTVTNVIEPSTLQPFYSVQASTPSFMYEDFYSTPSYPVTWDERDPLDTPSGAGVDWLPPYWYPISRYNQYQMGLLGSAHYDIDESATPDFDDSVES